MTHTTRVRKRQHRLGCGTSRLSPRSCESGSVSAVDLDEDASHDRVDESKDDTPGRMARKLPAVFDFINHLASLSPPSSDDLLDADGDETEELGEFESSALDYIASGDSADTPESQVFGSQYSRRMDPCNYNSGPPRVRAGSRQRIRKTPGGARRARAGRMKQTRRVKPPSDSVSLPQESGPPPTTTLAGSTPNVTNDTLDGPLPVVDATPGPAKTTTIVDSAPCVGGELTSSDNHRVAVATTPSDTRAHGGVPLDLGGRCDTIGGGCHESMSCAAHGHIHIHVHYTRATKPSAHVHASQPQSTDGAHIHVHI